MATATYPTPEMMFYQQYEQTRRNELAGILLALFLGSFGAHHFYLRRWGWGWLYVAFCWTGIPSLVSLVECFLMPGRVRAFNALEAMAIASSLGIAVPFAYPFANQGGYAGGATTPSPTQQPATTPCVNCGAMNPSSARFCSSCGKATGQYLTA